MEQLKRWREARGLSQTKLAARADVNPATVNQIEGGKRAASPATLRKLADALDVSLYDLLEAEPHPKAPRRSSLEPSLFNGTESERPLRYLRAWRAFVYRTARRWEEEPPTTREIATLFDTMTAFVEQGVFDVSDTTDPAEQMDLLLIMQGFERLNAIADGIEKDEEAKQRRATFTLIQENIGA
jgi:transcriptional regulator with XRE-family HTH domain